MAWLRRDHFRVQEAFTKGVVLARCPGCDNLHLIADRLGWFEDDSFDVMEAATKKGDAVRRLDIGHGVAADAAQAARTITTGVFELTPEDLATLKHPSRSVKLDDHDNRRCE